MSLSPPPQCEQQQKQYPYQSLPHDVWSECLSYLPPNELSQASELLPLASTNTNQTTTNSSDDAEYAAWLAIRSMVEAAENFWEAEDAQVDKEIRETNLTAEEEESTRGTARASNHWHAIHKLDIQAVRLRQLVSKDVSMVGDLFRATTSTSQSASGCCSNQNATREEEQTVVVRFQDETWQELYSFLYSVLSVKYEYDYAYNLLMGDADDDDDSYSNFDDGEEEEDAERFLGVDNENEESQDKKVADGGVRDKEAIALAMGLVFGMPALKGSLMTPERRKTLGSVSHSCSHIARCDPLFARKNLCSKNGGLGQSRCYLLSLRLAEEGLWENASEIIKSKLPSEEDESILSIDGMIYASTFLIDRLYSQTYVKHGVNDEELATAVKLGRRAVRMAEQLHKNTPTTASSYWSPASDGSNTRSSHKQPPPPMESLFANNAVRLMHAKLALGKALALLAQHIGLKATDTSALEWQHGVVPREGTSNGNESDPVPTQMATPELRVEHEHLWHRFLLDQYMRKRIAWTNAFFEESRKELQEGLFVCQKQEELLKQTPPSKITGSSEVQCTSTTIPILPLQGALESAESERQYCVAGAAAALGMTDTTHYYSRRAIESFTYSFRTMMEGVLDVLASSSSSSPNGHNYSPDSSLTPQRQLSRPISRMVETTLDYLVRCGKDLGKTCGFANYVGVDYREALPKTDNGKPLMQLNPKLLFDFVHLVSIYRHGSFHPTTKNIERLAGQQPPDSNQISLAQKYNTVAAWLVADFGNDE